MMLTTQDDIHSHEGGSTALLDRNELAAVADVAALEAVVRALESVTTVEGAAAAALDAVRTEFGWAYGSYWTLPLGEQVLRFSVESGSAGAQFREVTRSASFAEGVGLSGRAWRSRDLVFAADLGDLSDCVRAPIAQRAGVKSGVCFPITVSGEVVGTMDFFALETLDLAESRLQALRTVGRLVSQTMGRLEESTVARRTTEDSAAVNQVLSSLGTVAEEADALRTALDAVRSSFGWDYGSVWALQPGARELTFSLESGTVNPEFRQVTLTASFPQGVGLAGRAWRDGRLIFVPDLGEVHDCVRAPVAQRAGVKAGVCFPITVAGQVVATMDFFATRKLVMSDSRLAALSSVGDLVGQTIGRLRKANETRDIAEQLMASVTQIAAAASRSAAFANEVVASTGEVVGRVGALQETSATIGQIVEVINSIADQTNLLALNATIEAARAGEHGRGFAVVAGEVKQLAGQTADATREVRSKITAIQNDTEAVSGAIGQIEENIRKLDEMQTELSATLEEQSAIARSFSG